MNIATNNQNQGQGNLPDVELPPLLSRVPWLLSSNPSPMPPLVQDAGEASVDASVFQPHQLFATADTGAVGWDASPTRLRIDSPQKAPSQSAAPQTAPPNIAPAQAEPTASESHYPAATPAPAVRPVKSPGSQGITHLRFDPPESSPTEQPSPQTAPTDSASHQPSRWHEMIATVDNTLRQYNRVIMLAALLTAAGLMMLVLESQHPAADPTSNDITPANMPSDSMMQPMPLAESSTEPAAVPERIAMAEGPRSSKPRSASASTLSSPDAVESDANEGAALALQPVEPYREAHTLQVPIVTPSQPEEADGATYPTTNAPAFRLLESSTATLQSAVPDATDSPIRARLSRELKPANMQIK